jgi:hypothetical protein
MRQQINLYQPIFTETRGGLAAKPVAIGFVLILAGLATFSWNEHRQTAQLQTQLEQLQAQQNERQAALEQEGQSTANETPEQLDARVKQLDAQVAERTRAVQILQSGAAGQTIGFANRMEALAKRQVDGLWLDQMILSGTNGAMTLRGATIDPEVVPQYLRGLAAEPALSGTRFDDFIIERPSKLSTADADAALTEGTAKSERKNEGPVRFRAGSRALETSAEAAS